jgi:hypothetical protein
MTRGEILWLAFEKFAIFFSFMVAFILVMALLAIALATLRALPVLEALRTDMACPLIADVRGLVEDLDNAVITQTIHISQTIPVSFVLELDKNVNTQLTRNVRLQRPTTFTLPAGGGQINGSVTMVLPQGQKLPVHMTMDVPVSESLPVNMDVPVAIPLRETDLGPITSKLKELLMPYMYLLDDVLGCSAP